MQGEKTKENRGNPVHREFLQSRSRRKAKSFLRRERRGRRSKESPCDAQKKASGGWERKSHHWPEKMTRAEASSSSVAPSWKKGKHKKKTRRRGEKEKPAKKSTKEKAIFQIGLVLLTSPGKSTRL